LPVGPTSPNPMPMLPKQRKEAAKLVRGSAPLSEITTVPTTPVRMYTPKKVAMDTNRSSRKVVCPTLTWKTPLG